MIKLSFLFEIYFLKSLFIFVYDVGSSTEWSIISIKPRSNCFDCCHKKIRGVYTFIYFYVQKSLYRVRI